MIVKIVSSKKELADAFQVRNFVFVKEQRVPIAVEIDAFEEEATHFVGYVQDTPIAAGRLRWIDDYGKLERLCVLQEHRGQHFGTKMIQAMEAEVVNNSYQQVKLHAQTQAMNFYERLGYKPIGNEFFEAGIPHITMMKNLAP